MLRILLTLMAASASLGFLTWLLITVIRGSAVMSVREWHTDMTPEPDKETRP